MDEIERRLRAAMIGASEPASPGLLANVYRQHRRHRRRVIAGYVGVAAALVLAIPPIGDDLGGRSLFFGTRASHPVMPSGLHRRKATPAVGTISLTCNDANWGQLQANWRSVSFNAGPLWFVFGRQDGYVHDSGFRMQRNSSHPYRSRSGGVMIVEVSNGATVTMKPAPAAGKYFHFIEGFDGPSPVALPTGDTGFTFTACPRENVGPNGRVTDFYLGFSITAGRAAKVDIWPRPDARPIQVIFTCGARPSPCK